MSAGLFQLKELAILLYDSTSGIPRAGRWQSPWSTACRGLLEHSVLQQHSLNSLASRLAAARLCDSVSDPSLYFAPNTAWREFVSNAGCLRGGEDGQRTWDVSLQERRLPRRILGPHLKIEPVYIAEPPILRAIQRPFTGYRIPLRTLLRGGPAELAWFSSDARRLAPDEPPDEDKPRPSPKAEEEVAASGTEPTTQPSPTSQTPAPTHPSLTTDHQIPEQTTSHSQRPPSEKDDAVDSSSDNLSPVPPAPVTESNDMLDRMELNESTQPAQNDSTVKVKTAARSTDSVAAANETLSEPEAAAEPSGTDTARLPARLREWHKILAPFQWTHGRLLLGKGKHLRRTKRIEILLSRQAKAHKKLWHIWDRAVQNGWGDHISIGRELNLAVAFVAHRPKNDAVDDRNVRGKQLKKLLDHIESRARDFVSFGNAPAARFHFNSLRVYQYDLQGNWPAIHKALPALFDEERKAIGWNHTTQFVNIVRFLLEDAMRYDSPLRVVDLVLDNFEYMEPAIRRWPNERQQVQEQWHFHTKYFQRLVDQAINSIHRPVEWLQDKEELWDEERRRHAARLFLASFIRQSKSEVAHAVFQYQRKSELKIPMRSIADLAVLLIVQEAATESQEAFQYLASLHRERFRNAPWHLSMVKTGLIIAAHLGDVEASEAYWRDLTRRKQEAKDVEQPIGPGEKALRLHAFAVAGRIEDLLKIFEEMFPADGARTETTTPNIIHYTAIILAYSRLGDLESTNRWLSTMTKEGIKPDVYVYNTILRQLADRKDVNSVRAVLEQMQKAKIVRDRVTYISVINMYARLRDPVNAENVFKQALKDGLPPSRQLLNRLINAHVEAASWRGVIRAFDYVMNLPYRTLRLSVQLCNVLLKAYVLIGAPHYTVRGTFSRLSRFGVVPDFQSYCLVIQSAVDTGRTGEANRLFRAMQANLGLSPSHPSNVYPLSLLVAGHLRRNEHEEARQRYNEMVENNIQPSTSTFAAIIRSHATAGQEDSLQIAEDFLKEVLEQPGERHAYTMPANPDDRLMYLFVPILQAHTTLSDSREVERVYAEYLEKGGSSNILTLTILMTAYGRAGDVDAVAQVWQEIHKLGLELVNAKPVFPGMEDAPSEEPRGNTHTTWLAYALSVYIDALSAAGRHTTIAETLGTLREQKFAFSAHNWNHIAVAMLRAGEPERAFEVLERVILRYKAESERLLRERDMHPQSPLLSDQPKQADELDRIEHRASGGKERRRFALAAERAVPFPGRDVMGEEQINSVEDMIQSLHVLYQVSPAWHVWRPHYYLLRALGKFLTGRLQDDDGIDLGLSAGGGSPELIERIYARYPAAVEAVLVNERRMQQRKPMEILD